MLESYGKSYALEYSMIFENFEKKKLKISKYFEENKNTAKTAFERVLVILEEAKLKFDFSRLLAGFEIRAEQVYKSGSAGVKDWSFPAEKDISWSNPLVAITNYSKWEFNFVFKNGQTSDATMSG
jgi:hypothetical protein